MSKHFITMTVNGRERSLHVDSTDSLLDVLRNRLDIKSVKDGCGTGDCGLCAVILNGRLVNSCIVLAAQCRGAQVTTLEGLLEDPQMKSLQGRFLKYNAAQCGFCTPAMLVAAKDILSRTVRPTEDDIKAGISGVLCRCTGYYPIIQAIQEASEGRSR
ncbi:MAG TPA: (2Fe-2S)-binding protein [Conexivisphaerales archaeon]|nr:(2Fe-2S)-binding protein [Conexivisphaerales archaeon]